MNYQVYAKRRERRLKQEDVAKILFISRNSYGFKERGEIPFTVPEGMRLANYYGCTLDELFGGENDANYVSNRRPRTS